MKKLNSNEINKNFKIIIKTIISTICLYLIQFIVIPMFYLPSSNEGTFILILSTIIILIIAMLLISDKLRYYLLSDILYIVLLFIYHGKGLYGIGMRGMNLDGMQSFYERKSAPIGILIMAGVVLILQVSAWIILKIFKYIYNRRKNK